MLPLRGAYTMSIILPTDKKMVLWACFYTFSQQNAAIGRGSWRVTGTKLIGNISDVQHRKHNKQ